MLEEASGCYEQWEDLEVPLTTESEQVVVGKFLCFLAVFVFVRCLAGF